MEMSLDYFKFHRVHISCYRCFKWGENYLAIILLLGRNMSETYNFSTPFICMICVPSEPVLLSYFDFGSVTHRKEDVAEQCMYSLLG